MTGNPETPDRPTCNERIVLLSLAVVVYLVPSVLGRGERVGPAPHFAQLAASFLHGTARITISSDAPGGMAVALNGHAFPDVNELIPTDGESFYCAYPPLPAVLLMPFVVLFGSAVQVGTACRVVSVLNVLLMHACLGRLPQRLGLCGTGVLPVQTQARRPGHARIALTLLFAFGTVCWHNAEMGGDWHLAHAVALAAMLLALREWLAAARPLAIGGFVALALLTRPTAALGGLLFVLPLLRAGQVPKLVRLLAAPAVAVLLLALYNNARFGSPTDFGYERMILRGDGLAMMQQYGQFHPHFVPRNVFWFFLAPPWPTPDGRFPFLGFDPRGLSLFIATPALWYAVAGLARRWREAAVRDALIAVAACLLPLLLYFNTGYAQFGHRFSMDYLPLLMVLVVAGMGARPSRLAYAAIAVSILIQTWGVFLVPLTRLPGWIVLAAKWTCRVC